MPARWVVWMSRTCSAVAALTIVGCAAGTDAGTSTGASTPTAAGVSGGAGPSQNANAAAVARPNTAGSGGPAKPAIAAAAIPAGAKYTILCLAFPGPGHLQQAASSKENLSRVFKRNEFYVVHEENQSTIFFGYYREYDRTVDAKEAERADRDMAFVKSIAAGPAGPGDAPQPLFPRSLFVPLPTADPVAPPEFDLSRVDLGRDTNDPDRKYWSIAIAAYTTDATPTGVDAGKNRKQLAVESVLEARRQGVEAYFYHGPSISMVCIGAWPRRALRAQMTDTQLKAVDNGDPIIMSSFKLPKKLRDEMDATGKHVNVIEPNVEIDDASLLATWKNFRYYEVNGKTDVAVTTDPTTGQRKEQIKGTFLVEIPMAQQSSMLTSGHNRQAAQPETAPETNPLLPGQGMGGRLRSVGP